MRVWGEQDKVSACMELAFLSRNLAINKCHLVKNKAKQEDTELGAEEDYFSLRGGYFFQGIQD